MKPPVIPTDKEIEELIRETQKNIPDYQKVPKSCGNCNRYISELQYCPLHDKRYAAFMVCNNHQSKVQHLIERVRSRMLENATENKKIEYLISIALSFSEMAISVTQDAEARIKKQRDEEEDSVTKSALKKDLNLCEALETAYTNIAENLRKIDRDYCYYIAPYMKKAFTKKDGTYDVVNNDKFTSDQGEFIELILKYNKACFLNEKNSNLVFGLLDSLENDQYFPFNEKDMNHYHIEI